MLVAGCAGGHRPVSDVPVKIGRPYTVRGVTYTPRVDPTYDAVGYASWYGDESGDRTANGEKYRPEGISAAHRTLPLPTYVEVTSLDTGRTILVRVNDRGPFTRGRIIDLSRGAASLLGIREAGRAPVRVRVVDPSDKDKGRLRRGKPARQRPDASRQMLIRLRDRLARNGAEGG
jgi:rare lipoprotein A